MMRQKPNRYHQKAMEIKLSYIHFILFLLLLTPSILKSQPCLPQDSLLNKLSGKWVLTGTIDGQKTVHDINVSRVLNGQYIEMQEISREKDANGKPLYEAIVYFCWEAPKNQYSCLWLDNTGNGGLSNGITGRALPARDKIELVFTFSDTVKFHTTFLYETKSDTWQMLMDAETNGQWQPFARTSLARNIQVNR